VVLFHGCCHNPTGIDPTLEQWQQLAKLSVEKGWLPLFDFAYQGFARGLEEDAEGLRAFAALHKELMVASSYSKNFGLYNERVVPVRWSPLKETVDRAFSQMKSVIRANYSNPPAHGASVVATILSNDALRAIWEQELNDMRQRIQRMRLLFVNTLQEKGADRDFSFIIKQNGMFSFSGLTKEQVLRLREEFGVYAVASGRMNVAGMTPDNMAPLCEAIVAVL
jgi:aspartate aminotransferase